MGERKRAFDETNESCPRNTNQADLLHLHRAKLHFFPLRRVRYFRRVAPHWFRLFCRCSCRARFGLAIKSERSLSTFARKFQFNMSRCISLSSHPFQAKATGNGKETATANARMWQLIYSQQHRKFAFNVDSVGGGANQRHSSG